MIGSAVSDPPEPRSLAIRTLEPSTALRACSASGRAIGPSYTLPSTACPALDLALGPRRREHVAVGHAHGALEQPAVQVEDVTRVGLASRRPAQQQRHLAVGPGMFGEVVIDHQRVAAVLAELLADGAAGIRRNVLQRRRLVGRRHHDDGVLERAVPLEDAHGARHRRPLLADGDVDADQVLALLVDDGVDGDGGLARLPVADDQLALAAADRDHRVDGGDAGLDRRVDVLAANHAGAMRSIGR